jgi:hypothetical protein
MVYNTYINLKSNLAMKLLFTGHFNYFFFFKKGSQLVAGSLNVLETVGKKTFETLNEKDPNLEITRGLLKKVPTTSQKPNLSQVNSYF